MKVGIINGSIRTKRATDAVANYIHEISQQRTGETQYELIGLAKFQVPLLTSPVHPMAMKKKYDDANVQSWSHAIDACDGFVFVTPEYNHGVPGWVQKRCRQSRNRMGGQTCGFRGSWVGRRGARY